MMRLAKICAVTTAFFALAESTTYSPEFLTKLRESKCLNCDDVAAEVGFTGDQPANPYNTYNKDIQIDTSKNCYVKIVGDSDAEPLKYKLFSFTDAELSAATGQYYLTHTGPCGVCSDFPSLALYLEMPNLSDPVRACGFNLFNSQVLGCLETTVGFEDKCLYIWYYNTLNTRQKCLLTCAYAALIGAEPIADYGISYCSPFLCSWKINSGPACEEYQYKTAPAGETNYRLNPCLQCDECNSGPLFKKIAGRTRRGSGIETAIPRPDVEDIEHRYGLY